MPAKQTTKQSFADTFSVELRRLNGCPVVTIMVGGQPAFSCCVEYAYGLAESIELAADLGAAKIRQEVNAA